MAVARAALAALIGTVACSGTDAPFDYFTDETGCPDMQSGVAVRFAPQSLGIDGARAVLEAIPRWPELQQEIVWVAGDGQRIAFPDWTADQQQRLLTFFQRIAAQEPDLGIHCPEPRNIWTGGQYNDETGTPVRTGAPIDIFYTADQAFDVYAAHVAHALFLEAFHRVPWSVFDFPAAERVELFDSSRTVTRLLANPNQHQYPPWIQPNRDFWIASTRRHASYEAVCDPREGYDFIRGIAATVPVDLLGPTPRATMVNITAWMQVNVGHGGRGDWPDLARATRYLFLRERLELRAWEDEPDLKMTMAQFGCQSASNLVHDLARSVNIPTLHVATPQPQHEPIQIDNVRHSGVVLGWAGPDPRALEHADDIYANDVGPVFPVDRAGRPLSACERRRVFFDQNWIPPATLQAWGLVPAENLLPMTTSSSRYSNPGSYDRADDGIMLGYWPPAPDPYRDMAPGLRGFLLERQHLSCAAPLVLAACRRSIVHFRDWVMPPHGTPEQMWHDLRACASAYGGCSAVARINHEWFARRGKHTGTPR